jgi:hypothetical protein
MKLNQSIHNEMPKRNLDRVYQLDANRINAMQKDAAVNQLELWHRHKVIFLEMSLTAYDEACFGNQRRSEKADDYTWMSTNESWDGIEEFRRLIESIVFPHGAKNKNEKDDVSILLDSKMSYATLVTYDGRSRRQRGGMLGNADRLLSEVGIRVITAEQAVSEIRECIRVRDEAARNLAKATGRRIPSWVGRD